MQSDISYTNLQSRVRSGAVIRWCGMTQDDRVLVQLIEHDETEHVVVDVNHIINVWPTNGVLRNGEALEPLLDVGYTPSNSDAFATLRKATVLGINISGDCEVGSAKPYTRLEGCTCGYDIELDLRDEQREGFPLPDTPVLSVALWCSCGFRYFISTMDINLDYCYTAKSQQAIVAKFIDVLSDHTPLWLVGWNCYSFDNTCLVYHASSSARKLFRKVKIGSASTVDYGYILDMPGIYNVDPFGYMQRSAGYSKIYMDLSLYGVAMRLGTTMKTEMPDLYTVSDPVEILEYNMNDSAIAAEIWTKTGLVTEIPSLAIGSCSHVYDCIRHMTSVTARCPYTTEALKVGMMIDWSPCRSLSEYSGGKVFEPIRGLHKDVVICDFSSMYPTIMIDANISPETIEVRDPDNNAYGNVWFDESRTYVRLDDCVTSFPVDAPSIQRDILIKYVKLRNENRKTNPVYAGTLKVVANSVYGATGYENSPMYSPLCSSSVTAIGRWSLERACSIFEQYGLKVIYGDTDSCFIAATHVTHAKFRGDVRRHAMSCLTRIKEFFCGTPLKNMNMSLESYHERTLLIEKKKYCATVDNGNIIYKGMSIVRRDTLGICKKACETVTKSILYSSSMKEANDLIARFVNGIVSDILNNRLSHSDVSKIAKRNQKRCYVYTGEDGLERSVPIDIATNIVPDYNMQYVVKAFQQEVLRITIPSGLGSIHRIMETSDVLF